jgi:hypothetical protein
MGAVMNLWVSLHRPPRWARCTWLPDGVGADPRLAEAPAPAGVPWDRRSRAFDALRSTAQSSLDMDDVDLDDENPPLDEPQCTEDDPALPA